MAGGDLARFSAAALYSQHLAGRLRWCHLQKGLGWSSAMQVWTGSFSVPVGTLLSQLDRKALSPYFTDGKTETWAEVGFCPNGCSISGVHSQCLSFNDVFCYPGFHVGLWISYP